MRHFCKIVTLSLILLMTAFACNKPSPQKPDPKPEPEPVQPSIVLSVSELELEVGESSEALYATVTPEGYADKLQWNVADKSIVTFEGGVLSALKEGSTTILAYIEDAEASCVVNVRPAFVPDPQVGDYFYSDGTWSDGAAKPVAGKSVIGLVFQTAKERIAKQDVEDGFVHGYVVSTKMAYEADRSVRPGLDVKEMEYSLDEGIECLNNCKLGSSWYANLNGRWETAQVYNTYFEKGATSKVPAFSYVVEKFPMAPASTSGWFIPSVGQVWDLVTAFCGGEYAKALDENKTLNYDITYYFRGVIGFDAISSYNARLAKVPADSKDELYVPAAESYHNYCGLWTSTLYDNSDGAACVFYIGSASGESFPGCDWVNNPYFVLPILAF